MSDLDENLSEEDEITPDEQFEAVVRFSSRNVARMFNQIMSDKRFTVPYTDLLSCAAVTAFKHVLFDFLMVNLSLNLKTNPVVQRILAVEEPDKAEELIANKMFAVCEEVVDEILPMLPNYYVPLVGECVQRTNKIFNSMEEYNDS